MGKFREISDKFGYKDLNEVETICVQQLADHLDDGTFALDEGSCINCGRFTAVVFPVSTPEEKLCGACARILMRAHAEREMDAVKFVQYQSQNGPPLAQSVANLMLRGLVKTEDGTCTECGQETLVLRGTLVEDGPKLCPNCLPHVVETIARMLDYLPSRKEPGECA
jgi:hypothetical protein